MKRFAIALVAGLLATACQQPAQTPNIPTPPVASEATKAPPDAMSQTVDAIVARYRKTIVLLEDENSLPEAEREKASLVGKIIFQENHQALSNLSGSLTGEIEKAVDRQTKQNRTHTRLECGAALAAGGVRHRQPRLFA